MHKQIQQKEYRSTSKKKGLSLQQLRDNLSSSIRRQKIQQVQKYRRQQQLKTNNPNSYVQIIKCNLQTKQLKFQQIDEIYQFIEKNFIQSAQSIQNNNILQILIVYLINKFKQQEIQQQNTILIFQQIHDCQYPMDCECIGCNDEITQISDVIQKTNIHQRQIQIDSPIKNIRSIFRSITTLTIDNMISQYFSLIQKIHDNFSTQNKQYKNNKLKNENNNEYEIFFMNISQILQDVIRQLLKIKEKVKKNSQAMISTIIFKIVHFLQKLHNVCWLQKQDFQALIILYDRFFAKLYTEQKHISQFFVTKINSLLRLLSYSPDVSEIMREIQKSDGFNRILLICIKSVNQNMITHNDYNKKIMKLIIKIDFFMKLLSDIEFIQKQINDELKQILTKLLNFSLSYDQQKYKNEQNVDYFYYSSPKRQSQCYQKIIIEEQSIVQKHNIQKCIQSLIQTLYLQMQLSDDDLNQIINIQPFTKHKIQRIIDADSY